MEQFLEKSRNRPWMWALVIVAVLLPVFMLVCWFTVLPKSEVSDCSV